jgi:hypothetical protein
MASLWEIWDVTDLVYDQYLGYAGADAGEGPPTKVRGWVRTGYHSPSADFGLGIGNCQAWTSESANDYGTQVYLVGNWDQDSIAVSPWSVTEIPDALRLCSVSNRVWCVEDR